MRKLALSAALAFVAGCASQPGSAPATTAAPAPAAAPVAAAAAAPAATTAATNKTAPSTVQQALRAGYKIVDKNGKKMYCREETKTGSRVQRETICLTEQELAQVQEASKRNLDHMSQTVPPPWGK